jgi:sugar lactone lactonase YvrE
MPRRVQARPFFRPALEDQRYLPECPRVIGGSLLWLSIQYAADRPLGGINVLDLTSRDNVHHALPGRPGFFVETAESGVLLVGLERRLVLYDLRRRLLAETLAHIPDDPSVIINDGVAIPGGVIFGTKHLGFSQPVAALYHYDLSTRQVRELLGGQTCSNGKYLHDGLLVDIDSQPKTITEYRYHPALGRLAGPRLVTRPEVLPALPDGLRPMPGGQSAIVAFYNQAHVADGIAQEIRLSDGEVLTEWILPGSPRVTCPELGALDGAPCVFFTTAVEGMPQDTRAIAPEAGTIFVAEVTAPIRRSAGPGQARRDY